MQEHLSPCGAALPSVGLAEMGEILKTHPFGRVIGAYSRRPLKLDYVCVLPADLDPSEIERADVVRLIAAMDAGGAVALWGMTQELVDQTGIVIEMMAFGGRA